MGVVDGAGGSAGRGWQWDVVLSFAGAQRGYVEQVAAALRALGVRCFYDADEQIGLWGKYLAEELPAIYGERAAAAVVFLSAEYAVRDWTRVERRAALARAVRERREYVLPARFDDSEVPALLSGMAAVDLRGRSPEEFAAMIAAKLAALGITSDGGAVTPAGRAGTAGPRGAVRVGEADLRRLGVHAAITMPEVPQEVPPEYVPRDVDAAGQGVRARVAAAAQRGGFVLLVGGSSVGKTRCAAESVKALLPDWWLVHPAGPAEIAALAQAPPRRTVVWLDELQRYLDGEHGLTGGVVRALLNAPDPVVIIGTLWPDRYAVSTSVLAPGCSDSRAREREVLNLADVIRIDAAFSPAEQDRARAAAGRDPRLKVALDAGGYGLTQTLAAAPQLVARWADAQATDPYAWAVLAAALDTARLGARGPLSADLLRTAAPGYCTGQQQAEAPANWFDQALSYATSKLHGAVAALTPTGTGMGQISGYLVADYLLQHASAERRHARVPATAWDAIIAHIGDPADAALLAHSARVRFLFRYSIPLYRRAAGAGDTSAAVLLAERLDEHGDLDEAIQALWTLADLGNPNIASRLAGLLAKRGDLDGLRARADAGDRSAAQHLDALLAERGDLDGLQARADAGDGHAAWLLADLFEARSDIDAAAQTLSARADAGDPDAASRLAGLLAERGDLDGLRARADADAGDGTAASALANLLVERGDLDGLRARADTGDWYARRDLVLLLAREGDADGLRARADAGDRDAAFRLADLLAKLGDLDEATRILRTLADTGDPNAAGELTRLLARYGDADGLRALAQAGDMDAARLLAGLLAERGDVDELHARADAGDINAAFRLADHLAEHGDLDGAAQVLQPWAVTGNPNASTHLSELLTRRRDLDGLRARADAGDSNAAIQLAQFLAAYGDLDQAIQILRAFVGAGEGTAILPLADVLTKRGDLDEAKQILHAYAAADDDSQLAELLADCNDLDGLHALLNTGNSFAGWSLYRLLQWQGHAEDAERLRKNGLNPDGSIARA